MSTGITLRSRRQRGFTLTEILVTTAIFAVIMIAALTVYDRSNQVFKTSAEAADLQQSTRIGFDKLVSDLRMAGFDYNRGGEPTGEGQISQPDEQIEYAGPTAVVFRANFNYNTAASVGNGLELNYEPKNVKDQPIFPYVTTSNNEIIAYVLRSNDASKNTSSISFYVDDYIPRAAFPSTIVPAPKAGNPSQPEEAVTISGIDTTNANPPYTLYRLTVSDVKAGNVGTPVAENIRSMNFMYYADLAGTKVLTEASGDPITTGRDAGGGTFTADGTGAIGGDGQYDPNNPGTTSNFTDRSQRALISAIRVKLVGMNANKDLGGYTVPTETISAIKNYKQYSLESLVVPRNLGLTGFPEPNYNAPGPPTIVDMCVGHCGAPVMYWTPPTSSGDVTKYRIEWDTVQTGAYANGIDVTDPNATSAIIPDDGVSDVSQTRWYHILAYNDNGASVPSTPYSVTPQNKTRPKTPTALTGPVSAQTNQIPLSWTAPIENVSGKDILACTGAGGSSSGTTIPPQGQEIVKYRVVRGTTANFDPADTTNAIQVLGVTSTSQPASALPGGTVNWIDTGANSISAAPPSNCTQYYYRVRAVDRCFKQPNWNVSNDPNDSISDWYPATGMAAMGPYQATYAGAAPTVPPAASIDRSPTASGCPDPQAPTSNNCRITVQWQKAITDTATPPNPIGVDWYVLTRASRVEGSNGAFVPDASFGQNGQREINCDSGICTSGFSQSLPSVMARFVDTPPMYLGGTGGPVLEYQYTIAAKNCSLYSGNAPNGIAAAGAAPNPSVIYPGCSVNPTIVQQAGTNANNLSGDSPQQAWAFNADDQVVVTPATGTTVNGVDFDLNMWPQGTPVGNTYTVPSPGSPAGKYVFTWSDQIDNQVYALRITIHTIDAQGATCNEVRVKYIRDLQAAACFIGNVTPPSPVIVTHPSNPESDHIDFTITNSGAENIKFNIGSPAFQGSTVITWKSPDLPNHTELALSSLQWVGPGVSTTDIICNFGSSCTPAGIAVSSISSLGTTATVNTSSAHGLATGDKVTIQGATQAVYNGTFTVTVVNSTRFTYSLPSAFTNNANGTITATAFRKTTRSVPSGMLDIPAGTTFTLRLFFQFDGHGSLPSLPSTPSAIDSICLSYQIASEPGSTKFCNLVGTIANNPGGCN